MSEPERQPNRLIQTTSPYLQQHAHNPVDWYPWGPEALERARREDRPIFLSIGYSTCHWCHVMAHESFENPAIAAIMNENFVNIKLDREERPDLDEIYMNAVQILTGHGGWPLSVFLTPDLKPFYGGTYFPPEDRGGLPGFPRLLLALSQTYQQNRDQLTSLSLKVQGHLQRLSEAAEAGSDPTREALDQAAHRLGQDFDPVHGGLGRAPKFPRSLELDFLFHYYRLANEPPLLEKLAFTLEKMARGGIYDQLGGGFHRYSVDAAWVVPHFEKMLYDNALLPPLYLAHSQLTGSAFSRRIAAETLDFILQDMGAPEGGFYAAWDADSEGVEGKYYVWSLEEVEQVVGADVAPLVAAALGLTKEGNFEGANIFTRPLSLSDLAARFQLSEDQADETLSVALERLRQQRAQRVPPHRDEKVIVSWNGLTITALAKGAQVLGERRYYEAAARAARFILQDLCRDHTLFRIWTAGQVSVPGFSEDYAIFANALLDLYDTDFDPAWVQQARRLLALLDEKFLDPADGAYFYVDRDQETPLVRSKNIYDQVLPSGNSMAARVNLRLHRLTEQDQYQKRAQTIIRQCQAQAQQSPWGFAHLWTVQTLFLIPPLDLTLVGDPKDPRTQALLQAAYGRYLPERRLVLKDPAKSAPLAELLPWTESYSQPGEAPVAYLCRDFTCLPAVSAPEELLEKMAGATN
ncbi:MAG: thioredoxin domain-containing protein [Deltaproteobacteria bacterium]